MGAGNVKRAYAYWGALDHAPFRVLAFMALTSLDEDVPPAYWGGRESLALALGRMVPLESEAPEVIRERRAAFRAVDRVIKDLTKAGAITVLEVAGNRRNAKYALRLTPVRTTVSVVQQDHGERGPQDHGERYPSTTVSVTQDHGERGPYEEKDHRGLTEGAEGWREQLPAGVAHAPAIEDPNQTSPGTRCHCTLPLTPEGRCISPRCRNRRRAS